MTDWPILSTVTFLPLVGVALLLLTRGDTVQGRRNILNVSLLTTVFTFVVSLFIWINFDNSNTGFQMVEKHSWLGTGISYHVGVDGISMPLVMLTTFLMPNCRRRQPFSTPNKKIALTRTKNSVAAALALNSSPPSPGT